MVTGALGIALMVTATEFNKVTVQVLPNLIAFTVRIVELDNVDEVKIISPPVPNLEVPLGVAPSNN